MGDQRMRRWLLVRGARARALVRPAMSALPAGASSVKAVGRVEEALARRCVPLAAARLRRLMRRPPGQQNLHVGVGVRVRGFSGPVRSGVHQPLLSYSFVR